MADPYPRARRSPRPKASTRRIGRSGRSGRSTDVEETRSGARTEAVNRPPLSLRKRVGIVVALFAIGGTVIIAGGALTNRAPLSSGSPHPRSSSLAGQSGRPSGGSSVPDVAPVIRAPKTATTRLASWTAQITIPDLEVRRRDLRLRIYRNGTQVREVAVRRGSAVSVSNIALRRGVNRITAAFAGPGGVGPASAPVEITLDRVAPGIRITAPGNGAVISGPSVEVRGITEANAAVRVLNAAENASARVTAAADGSFRTTITLGRGTNLLTVTARDGAGNAATTSRTVVHGTGRADARLTLSRNVVRLRGLPVSLNVHLLVYDADGHPADGDPVTFSISPPGLPTSTYQTTTDHGSASWLGVTLARDSTEAGTGFVTALVTLGDGTVLRSTVHFVVR
jgi:hypothetical protein